jgi:hypothetical protein
VNVAAAAFAFERSPLSRFHRDPVKTQKGLGNPRRGVTIESRHFPILLAGFSDFISATQSATAPRYKAKKVADAAVLKFDAMQQKSIAVQRGPPIFEMRPV